MKTAFIIFIITLLNAGCATVESPTLENSAWRQARSSDPNISRFNGVSCVIDLRREALTSVANTDSTLAIQKNKLYQDSMEGDVNSQNAAMQNRDDALNKMNTAWDAVYNLRSQPGAGIRDELCQAYSYADFYRQRYIQLSGKAYTAGTWIDTLGLLTGIWTASAIGFDMHSDALLTSTLTMASLMGVKSYTQPGQRANLYLQGADRMQCIIATSSKIIGQSSNYKYVQLIHLARKLNDSLDVLERFTIAEFANAYTFANNLAGTNKENALTVLKSFEKLKQTAFQTRIELAEGLSLITGMPSEIINSVKDAELAFNRSFVSSAPDFKESLNYIQQAFTENAANKSKSAEFLGKFNNTQVPVIQIITTNLAENNGSSEFITLYNALSNLLTAHDSISSQLVNYSSVKAALTLCKAI